MENPRKPQINIELKKELVDELKGISNAIEVPYAQIVREAIFEKITQLKQNHPRLQGKPETAQAIS